MSAVSKPWRSTHQKRLAASSLERPSRTMASRSWSATPIPAVPAPKMTTRWLRSGVPQTRTAEIAAASVIAPVPCISSLKMQIRSRYFSRIRRPLPGAKSSHCNNALGNSFVATKLFPNALLQWEDFAPGNGRRILEKYRDRICIFNDDMQGTGAITLAAAISAVRVCGTPLRNQRVVIFGAGTAGIGVADQLRDAMVREG